MESFTDSDSGDASTLEFANKPPLKIPICYSVNQAEILQTLGNYTIAAHFESDEFLQKLVGLMEKPDSTKIDRLPAPCIEQFKCFSLDSNNYLYMDERLVIPKMLPPILKRSLHYGHPGRDSMLATVSNIWWPRLHREIVGIAKACQQCQVAGKSIIPLRIIPNTGSQGKRENRT